MALLDVIVILYHNHKKMKIHVKDLQRNCSCPERRYFGFTRTVRRKRNSNNCYSKDLEDYLPYELLCCRWKILLGSFFWKILKHFRREREEEKNRFKVRLLKIGMKIKYSRFESYFFYIVQVKVKFINSVKFSRTMWNELWKRTGAYLSICHEEILRVLVTWRVFPINVRPNIYSC